MAVALPANIPSPSINSFSIGPLVIHFYALAYLVGIAAAIIITRRRWRAVGGDPDIVGDIALWSVPAGIIGGRIYFDITTPMDIPHVWYGVFAVWDGGLGIWGGIALATVVGLWRLRRHGVNTAQFMDAVAPALLVAQGIGRIGNYFNKELFGRPTSLPWGLEIPYQYRLSGGIPDKYLNASTFQPTFLYELIFDFAWAAALVWLGHHGLRGRKIKPPGLFALYVFGYSAYRIFEESLRIDSSVYFLGLRLNTYIASALAAGGLLWFWRIQRRPDPEPAPDPAPEAASDPAEASGEPEPASVSASVSSAPASAAASSSSTPAPAESSASAQAPAPAEASGSAPAQAPTSAQAPASAKAPAPAKAPASKAATSAQAAASGENPASCPPSAATPTSSQEPHESQLPQDSDPSHD
jgi:prolipoprotein diacylglyceryl transferase